MNKKNIKGFSFAFLGSLVFSICSCDVNALFYHLVEGNTYLNNEAGIRFLVSKNKEKTEIDGFCVDDSFLNKEEWDLTYTLEEKDIFWGSKVTGFGKKYIWANRGNGRDDINDYDTITYTHKDSQAFHFRFMNSNITSIEQAKEMLNVKAICLTINLSGSKFNNLYFFNSDVRIYFIFENIDANCQTDLFFNPAISHFAFIIKSEHMLTGAKWSIYDKFWDGEKYTISRDEHMPIRIWIQGVEIVNHQDTIWAGELEE